MYIVFQIIMQIFLSVLKITFISFLIKLIDSIPSLGSLDHWNRSQTPVMISLSPIKEKLYKRALHVEQTIISKP